MAAGKSFKIALAGNPNSGKTSLFNELTGLNQKIGNYPGITVDKKTGRCTINENGSSVTTMVIDLPGAYSLSPKSEDERIVKQIITDPDDKNYPDVTIYVADASNLKRSLFFCSHLIDIKRPMVLALNMIDAAERKGIKVDCEKLSDELGIPVIPINARKGKGINLLKNASLHANAPRRQFLEKLNKDENRTIALYRRITTIIEACVSKSEQTTDSITDKFDKLLTHRFWGYVIFFALFLLIFQFIFSWAEYPMFLIDRGFALLGNWIAHTLPDGVLNDLLVNGILAGLGGIFIFIPQIAMLFFFIAILEDTGYMARVSFIMDKLMRQFGLSGRSVVPLASGFACAVPAVMSARTISNWKERMITIMVTPLMTCSARMPVYVLLISMVIPNTNLWGIINFQGLTLLGLYLVGFLAAVLAAFVFKIILKAKDRSYYVMEMPVYRSPRWKNIGLTIFEKVKVFVLHVGKIIIAISIVLWALASYAPGDSFERIEQKYRSKEMLIAHDAGTLASMMASEKLQESYAGRFGRAIEPAIEPIGFDWKIGIALITSFAAREVFVGTMATIYSVGNKENTHSIKEKMMADTHSGTGEKLYSLAVGLSLMIFYAFAMQCMSTLAVVYRETKHWKWPLIQFVYMTGLAYFLSFIVYQILK